MKTKNILMIIAGTFISALSFNIFLSPYKIIPGGVSGVSIFFHYLYDLDESLTIFLLMLMCLLIGLIFLGKKDVLKAILGSLFFTLFVYLIHFIMNIVDLKVDNMLLASIVGGAFYGLGLGLVYKAGYTTGGSDIIAKILNKYFYITMGTANLIINLILAVFVALIFGFEIFVYSALTVFIYSKVIDSVILGFGSNKSFYIITTHPKELEKFIINDLSHGVTIINGKGAYSKENKAILYVVIPTRDYYKLKDGLQIIDPNAFFFVSSSYEVGGGK